MKLERVGGDNWRAWLWWPWGLAGHELAGATFVYLFPLYAGLGWGRRWWVRVGPYRLAP